MIRGTTQPLYIDVDTDLTGADRIFVTFMQRGQVVVELPIDRLTVEAERLTFTLTETESLRFDNGECPAPVKLQIRAGWPNGERAASQIESVTVGRLLKDGKI